MTTGSPGPPLLPADVQNPMYLDPVLLDFPQLRLVMLHGADPWWDVAIRLLQRHRNLTMCTSAWS
jgi:predicted TIM-barrel fold metal-dependent hydrolase